MYWRRSPEALEPRLPQLHVRWYRKRDSVRLDVNAAACLKVFQLLISIMFKADLQVNVHINYGKYLLAAPSQPWVQASAGYTMSHGERSVELVYLFYT